MTRRCVLKQNLHARALVICGLLVAFLFSVTSQEQYIAAENPIYPGLLLWNKLDSPADVMNSEVGPQGSIYNQISFLPGKYGSGFSAQGQLAGIDFGSWDIINPTYNEKGTIEFWWQPARNYDEGNFSPDEVLVSGKHSLPLQWPFQILYRWREHQISGLGGFDLRLVSESGAERALYTGKVIPFEAGDWLHFAFVWDMNGLSIDPEVNYGVYANGQYYPLVDADNPGASLDFLMAHPDPAYLSLGYYTADYNNRMNGVMDNVKIWDFAKTDFSDRFKEAPNQAPVCDFSFANPQLLWPANHRMENIKIEGVVNPDNDPLNLSITSIFQDEPVGSGLVDGIGVGRSLARVRAERLGNGNGRVYHIGFMVTDGFGGSCNGEVLVGVPHNYGEVPVDDGALYNSTIRTPRVR